MRDMLQSLSCCLWIVNGDFRIARVGDMVLSSVVLVWDGYLTDAISLIRPICGAIDPSIATLIASDTAPMIALPLVGAACFLKLHSLLYTMYLVSYISIRIMRFLVMFTFSYYMFK